LECKLLLLVGEVAHHDPFLTETKVQLKSHHARFLCAEPSGKAVADRREAKEWETWTMVTANGKATTASTSAPR
jgi:hypothetical protein